MEEIGAVEEDVRRLEVFFNDRLLALEAACSLLIQEKVEQLEVETTALRADNQRLKLEMKKLTTVGPVSAPAFDALVADARGMMQWLVDQQKQWNDEKARERQRMEEERKTVRDSTERTTRQTMREKEALLLSIRKEKEILLNVLPDASVYEKEWALLKAERQCFDREVEAFRRTGGQLAGHYVGFGDAFTAAKEPRKEKQVLDSVANAGAHNPLNVEIQRQLDGEVRDFASQIRRCSNEDLAKIQRDLLSLRSAAPDE
eukprot:GEMP01058741.1.p1 GENE.GEMP01058741.1~~GEMP01058741.1.p1  ORF type:complete len:259 (+),score=86.26 GEMP01058741.1:134-910(+)